MASKINSINQYLTEGCGRCKLFQTPQCKVHIWSDELHYLRQIILKSELHEELKWSMPCYSLNGKNIVMLCAFKDYVSLSFFKGALLSDEKKLLISPGENSNSTRQFRFTNLTQIKKVEKFIFLNGKVKITYLNIINNKKITFTVSANENKVVETIPGWAHNIENASNQVVVGLVWANEIFDSSKPDTYRYLLK